jgi:hypothetical protein
VITINPVIRLDSKETFGVIGIAPLDLVAVRYQDLISKTTFGFNETYRQVRAAGGLHKFLNFDGQIMLSLIMRDKLIANTKPADYANAINALDPDSFTTIDGETYNKEYLVCPNELKRIEKDNEELLSLVKGSKPIGLVKGFSESQVIGQVKLLKSYGIDEFIFHISDFFRHHKIDEIRRGRSLAVTIRKNCSKLTLYGYGSQKRLQEYAFADRFITSTHFRAALHGWKFEGTKQVKYKKGHGYNQKLSTTIFLNFTKM